MSLGIDDNNAQDIPYWKELSKKYGKLNITWNLIVCGIEGPVEKGRFATYRNVANMAATDRRRLSCLLAQHVAQPRSGSRRRLAGPRLGSGRFAASAEQPSHGLQDKALYRARAGVPVFSIFQGAWDASIKKYYAAARGGSGGSTRRT